MRSDISKASNSSTNAHTDIITNQLKSLGCQLQINHRHQDFKQIRYHRNFQLKIGHKNRVYLKSLLNETELRKNLWDFKKFYIEQKSDSLGCTRFSLVDR